MNNLSKKEPFKIAVASGKGGTGKTTVSVNLQYFISKFWSEKVLLLDCDVEEPNDLIFFPESEITGNKEVHLLVPFIDTQKCTFCRKCVDWCEFNAIVVIPPVKFAQVNQSLCHSCGACIVACNNGAISENKVSIGEINNYKTQIGVGLTEGKLKIGSAMQTSVIKALKSEDFNNAEIIIYDAPPGTSCPVVTTVSDADFVVLVTEPTPFGVYDLSLTVDLLKEMNKTTGVIVNKSGLGNNEVYEYLEQNNIPILGAIPFNKNYASKYAQGNILKNILIETEDFYKEIISNIKKYIN
jgi:MinD superfamily P-loop ATPase